jgi:Predicted metal-dependent hydrolase of the TIM-barrel fold
VTVPMCLAPFSEQAPASFVIPANACDTHAHVISPDTQAYPFVADRTYTPPPADEGQYLKMLDEQGMQRGVLVQISVYGKDNRYMLHVLRRHPKRLRGVAVVDAEVSDTELESMHEAGVRGVRLNVLFKGGVGFDEMERLAHRIKDYGWHMQFLMDVSQLPELMPMMMRLPVPGVLDHMGHSPAAQIASTEGGRAMLDLLQHHGWWVKLSGAYRVSDRFDDFADVTPWAQTLVETAPERCLWGSDWPHVHIPKMVDTGKLRNQFAAWVPDDALRRQILVENPARLYDF